MAKGKRGKRNKSCQLPLKEAQNCVVQTPEGKQRLNLSRKELTSVPPCIQKFGDLDELDLSRNQIRIIPDFIVHCVSIRVLDLHSNYVSRMEKTDNICLIQSCWGTLLFFFFFFLLFTMNIQQIPKPFPALFKGLLSFIYNLFKFAEKKNRNARQDFEIWDWNTSPSANLV